MQKHNTSIQTQKTEQLTKKSTKTKLERKLIRKHKIKTFINHSYKQILHTYYNKYKANIHKKRTSKKYNYKKQKHESMKQGNIKQKQSRSNTNISTHSLKKTHKRTHTT